MKEGWGLVAVEANACGTPAIAFNVPGLCEAIDHPRSGLLAESEEEFVELVLRVLEDGDLRDRLSRAALKHAEQFNWDKAAPRSLSILVSEVNRVAKGQVCAVASRAAARKSRR
jgi:glycosyltransferase involved in cell wall biosynthesis